MKKIIYAFIITAIVGVAVVSIAWHGPHVHDGHAQDIAASFHHVRLNVVNPDSSIAYYKKFFSAVPITFRGVANATLNDRSYFLFNKVDRQAPDNSTTAIWHIGWGGVDGKSEYNWRTGQGMKWAKDIVTIGDDFAYFMYAEGPDGEKVEIFTGVPSNRYNHIHLLATDPNATRDWYIKHLGLKGNPKNMPNPGSPPDDMHFGKAPKEVFGSIWQSLVLVDGIMINIFVKPEEPSFWWNEEPIQQEFEKSEGHVIDHFAFSYQDIEPVYDRMRSNGVEIVKDISWDADFKLKSFFVRAPDNVLIEIVEADPLPDASWLDHLPPGD